MPRCSGGDSLEPLDPGFGFVELGELALPVSRSFGLFIHQLAQGRQGGLVSRRELQHFPEARLRLLREGEILRRIHASGVLSRIGHRKLAASLDGVGLQRDLPFEMLRRFGSALCR